MAPKATNTKIKKNLRQRDPKQYAEKKGIRQVAHHAGVSIATVSRVVNGALNVDARLSRKVWKAVAEIGYVPNRTAQALVSGRTRLLGLIVADITNPFFPELVRGFEDVALKMGFGILIGSTGGDPMRTGTWVQRMLQHGIEGLALLTFRSEPAEVYQMLGGIPSVEVEVGRRGLGMEVIEVNYAHGIRQAVQHLAVLGHRDIVFAAGPQEDFTAAERERCFKVAMLEAGCSVSETSIYREHPYGTLEGGIEAVRRILLRPQLPTALICSNDLMAIGALRMLNSHNIAVPQDISLIGLDDIHLAEFTNPTLTTVRIPRTELAEVTFAVLLAKLEGRPDLPAKERTIATHLVARESTNYPRSKPPQS
jgi:DNA-binding LacI/PurR family transcriptional regulator